MTRRELTELQSWLEAGVGVVLDEEPEPLLLRKHYLSEEADGFALTEDGKERAERLVAKITR
jgi:hypothetical protein